MTGKRLDLCYLNLWIEIIRLDSKFYLFIYKLKNGFFFLLFICYYLKGGAERLIVDAAVELASHGHNVHIFTAHHDKNRCFEETRAGKFYFRCVIFINFSYLFGQFKNNQIEKGLFEVNVEILVHIA